MTSLKERAVDAARAVGRWRRRWWVTVNRPLSLRATWRLSRMDSTRIPVANVRPGDAAAAAALAHQRSRLERVVRVSDATDRRLFILALLIVPLGLQGPLRWIIQRPTRRWVFYAFTAIFAIWLKTI